MESAEKRGMGLLRASRFWRRQRQGGPAGATLYLLVLNRLMIQRQPDGFGLREVLDGSVPVLTAQT
jgi:hypothetical protein